MALHVNLGTIPDGISFTPEALHSQVPGNFVGYNAVTRKSSDIALAGQTGIIRKTKARSAAKTVYEFLSLAVWNGLLDAYSKINPLQFRSPRPLGVTRLDAVTPELYMEFLNGYEIQNLSRAYKALPVKIPGQDEPLPLFPGCAVHLGALNQIKEREGVFHKDYDDRHVIFTPVGNVSIGVIDVENSRCASVAQVEAESAKSLDCLVKRANHGISTSRPIQEWYDLGREMLTTPSDGSLLLDSVVEQVRNKYKVDFDFRNRAINGREV